MIDLFNDGHLKIITTVPDDFGILERGGWENDSGSALTLSLINCTPFVITVTAIKLQLAVYDPHGQPASYNHPAKSFRVQWHDNNDTTIVLKPASALGPNATDRSLHATMDFLVEPHTADATGDCYVLATVSYRVAGEVDEQRGPSSNSHVPGVRATQVVF
ncbi:MAG TPA: hypothetical protein VFP84_30885 [Kofleriaceae bacterium]|nr:hypothetical protein [Kofleriaceae bacterium]